jgi:hypothetical protein
LKISLSFSKIIIHIIILSGGQLVKVTGANLPSAIRYIEIGNTQVNVLTSNSTTITFLSPKMNPGFYAVVIPNSGEKIT